MLSLSLKYVGRRLGVCSGGVLSVVKDREDVEEEDMREREACRKGGAFKHLNRVAAAAIASIMSVNYVELTISGPQQCFDDAWKSTSFQG